LVYDIIYIKLIDKKVNLEGANLEHLRIDISGIFIQQHSLPKVKRTSEELLTFREIFTTEGRINLEKPLFRVMLADAIMSDRYPEDLFKVEVIKIFNWIK